MSTEKLNQEFILDNFDDSIYEFISFKDFNLNRLAKLKEFDDSELPFKYLNDNGIIIKTYFVENEELGRKIPNKSYYNFSIEYNNRNLEKMDKRSISKILHEKLINYIVTERKINNNFQLAEKSISKNGIVKYEMIFSDYVSFNISIKPIQLGVDDVSLFIIQLPIEETKTYRRGLGSTSDNGESWKIEYAKSSRAVCKTCNEKIMKKEVRLGQPSYYQEHLTYKWHHLKCNKLFNSKFNLVGLEDLDDKDKDLVNKSLGISDDSSSKIDSKDIIERIISDYADSDGLTSLNDVYKFGKTKNLSKEEIKSILDEFEEEDKIYFPDQGKISLI